MSNPTPPPKKDPTLRWVLVGVAVVVFICCIGLCGFGAIIYTAEKSDSSYDTLANSPKNAEAAAATAVLEGDSATVDGIRIESGWSIVRKDISGLSLRNDTGTSGLLTVHFYFMDDENVIDDVICTANDLDAGETDDSPICASPFNDIDDHNQIRVAEGH